MQGTLRKHTRLIANAPQNLSQLLKLENSVENSRLKKLQCEERRSEGMKRNLEKRQ